MSKSCKQNGIRYDPRIKLLQVLIIGVLVFTLTGKKYEVLLFLSVFAYGMISGIYKTCFKFLALYIVLFMVAEISPLFISTTIHYFLLCFITLTLAAINMIRTSEISEVLASLQNMKIPYYINIPLAVILRFFPTLKQDITCMIILGYFEPPVRVFGATVPEKGSHEFRCSRATFVPCL